MSTATLPVELLIAIFELTTANVGPEVGVSQHVNQSNTAADASGQVAPTESSDEDSEDDENWDEGFISSSSDVESNDGRDWDISNEPTQSKEDDSQEPDAPGLLETRRQGDGAVEWLPLKTCRLVCRVWNELSIPLLFWDVNLRRLIVPHRIIPLLRGFEKHIIKRYGSFIHAMTLDPHPNFRLLGAHKPWRPEAAQYDYLLSYIIRQCPNLEILRLEYLFRRRTPFLHAAVVDLAERDGLAAISFISQSVIADREVPSGGWLVPESRCADHKLLRAVLRSVLRSPGACRTLRRLDIALTAIDDSTWAAIRQAEFSDLRTLTFRRCLRVSLGPIWRVDLNKPFWAPNERLTTLEFYDCQNAHSGLLCDLVRHFPSLKRLIVCTSGHDSDYKTLPPKRRWSTDPESLPRVREPLDFLHIEHGCQWEVLALAVVPTKTLMITNVAEKIIQNILKHDAELFIGLDTLRILPAREGVDPKILDNLCSQRGWKLVRDAVLWRPCRCHEEEYL